MKPLLSWKLVPGLLNSTIPLTTELPWWASRATGWAENVRSSVGRCVTFGDYPAAHSSLGHWRNRLANKSLCNHDGSVVFPSKSGGSIGLVALSCQAVRAVGPFGPNWPVVEKLDLNRRRSRLLAGRGRRRLTVDGTRELLKEERESYEVIQ